MSVQQIEPSTFAETTRLESSSDGERFDWSLSACWLLVAASIAVALGRLLVEYGEQLWSAEHYRFYPLVLGAACWLAWRRSQTPTTAIRPLSPTARLALWGVALTITAGSVMAKSPFGAAVALLIVIMAGLYEWGGSAKLRHYLPVLAVLLLILRLPFNWDQRMIVALQQIATSWASGVLDLIGVRHVADGVAIRLPQRDFFVEKACSGVHSLFATVAFVAVFAVATRRGLARFVPLFAAAVFWVIVANVVRVIAIVLLSTQYDLPVVEGFWHEVLGVIIFAGVIGLVLSTDRLLLFLWPQPEAIFSREPRALAPSSLSVDQHRSSHRFGAFAIAGGFACVAFGTFLLPAGATARALTPYANAAGLKPVAQDALPQSWDGWEQIDFQVRERPKDDLAGEISRIWNFRKGRLVVAISVDGPFDAWHDTEICYQGLGYTTHSQQDLPAPDGGASPGGFTELTISNSGGRHGYVLFMAYSETGQALHPPVSRNASVARLIAAWKDRVGGQRINDTVEGRVYQVQLFTESRLNFTEAERNDMTRLFHHLRREIARRSAASGSGLKAQGDDQ
jgi:exosortase